MPFVWRGLLALSCLHLVAWCDDSESSRIALGKALFYSSALSLDRSISCASCHVSDHGFADPRSRSVGVAGQIGTRHAPSIAYAHRLKPLFWDGRAANLRDQITHPLTGRTEMAMTADNIGIRVQSDSRLVALHRSAFGTTEASLHTVSMAIAAYVESLATFDSEFDHWRRNSTRLSREAQSGMLLFMSKGKCVYCHFDSLDREMFTDMKFHNTGVAYDPSKKVFRDLGRYDVTGDLEDRGRFRTPSLRNVALTGPYFHDGSARTLTDVIDHYDKGGRPNPGLDMLMVPLHLSAGEKRDLVAFLESLTDRGFRK